MPLGAFISSNEIMSALISNPPLGHITTFGGHPVCCAAGLASLDILIEEELIAACKSKSDLFRKWLNHPQIVEIRGEGLFIAVKLTDNKFVQYVISHAAEYGLILDYFLFCDDAFRIAPPLIISDDEILWACQQVIKLLDDASKI